MAPRRHRCLLALAALLVAAACRGSGSAPLPAPTVAADSVRTDTVAPGAVHRTYFIGSGPWVVHTLDVDRRRCWSPVPIDAAPAGPSRELLTVMASRARAQLGLDDLAGAVNADFFLFAPDGLPTGAEVHGGTVLFGPSERDVFAVDSARRLRVTRLSVDGWLVAGRDSLRVTRWNRPDANAVAAIDRAFGPRVDSARLGLAIPLRFVDRGVATLASGRTFALLAEEASDSGTTAPVVPPDGVLLLAGRGTSDSVRALLARIARSGDTVRLRMAMRPFHPHVAIGGNGVLLRDGAVPARLDSIGNEGFRGRNPRTAVGFDRKGRRMLVVAVDGRQPGYSMGMSLRELATLMQQLGAQDALNLDGGGSTTLVVPDVLSPSGVTIVNRPSDKTERKVANGIAVVRDCRR